MARTAPAPNIPPIPGMCPSVAVLGGGGDGGGGSGKGAGNASGNAGAGTGSEGDGAQGDQRGAPDYQRYPECGYASHPVDVVTGRAFTHPITDLALPGPLPLEFRRMYSSKMAHRDVGLGYGWGHTLGWEVEVGRRRVTVWNEQGIAVDFPSIQEGGETIGPWGWVLRRETWGYAVDPDDGCWYLFSGVDPAGRRYRLTAIEDRNRNRISLTYEKGRLVEVVDSAGRQIRVISAPGGRIAALQVRNAAAQGQWVSFAGYTYDEDGNLVSVTDADGYSWCYAYDEQHRLVSDRDRSGLTFYFSYDAKGRCVESWGDYLGGQDPSLSGSQPRYLHDGTTRAKGIHHCKFEYYDDGYTEVTDSRQVRRFFGNRHGTLDKRVEAGAVMTATYDDDGHILARADGLRAVTSFERDRRGRLVRVIDPLGHATSIDRDALGLPICITDPSGGARTFIRDRFGNLAQLIDPNGAVTSYQYDARGLVTEITTPSGGRTKCEYDVQGNRVAVVLPNGGVHRYTYDALGRVLSHSDPLGAVTRFAWSNRGDLIAIYDALGGVTRCAYDGEERPTELVNPKGQRTLLTWGGYNKLCARRDANGHEVRLVYNLEGDLTEVHNERGEIYRIEYDQSGRAIREIAFDGRVLRYRLDPLGRPIRITDDLGQVVQIEYDAVGRIVSRELPNSIRETFEYNQRGELVRAVNDAVECLFERDACGRILREVQTTAEGTHSVEVRYDLEGNRIGRSTSMGYMESIVRDALGARHQTVLGGATVIRHRADALGREVQRELPGGGTIESAFDPLGRLSGRRALKPAQAIPVAPGEPEWVGPRKAGLSVETIYRYDWDGGRFETWDRSRGHTRYEHDAVGQLLSLLRGELPQESFRYDPAGNVVRAGVEQRDYGPGNRLLRRGDTEYVWNASGRLVEKRDAAGLAVWRYRWNAAGLLESVESPDGLLTEFRYDAFARRVQKRVSKRSGPEGRVIPVSSTRFVWDGDLLVHEVRLAAQANGDPVVLERTYCFEDEGFAPIAHRDTQSAGEAGPRPVWVFYVNDPLGTPDRLLGEDGSVEGEIERSAWGRAMSPSSGGDRRGGTRATTPLRFPGQYEDEETGLSYNRNRYYDPEAGRYISADPIALGGGLNEFSYPDPLSGTDPLGLALGRATPWIPDGNPDEGWQHIDERHVSGTQPGGDLFAPGTTRAQCEQAARTVVRKGRRISDPRRRIQTFERRVTVNGQTERVRVVVDSHDNNRVITMFPARQV